MRAWQFQTTVLAVTVGLFAAPAEAQVVPDASARLLQQNRLIEMQQLRNEQRRLQFQQRQQFHRELDREAIRSRPPRPEVPKMQPNCQVQVYGSSYSTICR